MGKMTIMLGDSNSINKMEGLHQHHHVDHILQVSSVEQTCDATGLGGALRAFGSQSLQLSGRHREFLSCEGEWDQTPTRSKAHSCCFHLFSASVPECYRLGIFLEGIQDFYFYF